MHRMRYALVILAGLAVVPLAYTGLWLTFQGSMLVRPPSEIITALSSLLTKDDFWRHLGATSWRWVAVVVLAVAVGSPLGMLLRVNARVWRVARVSVDYLRSTPAVTYSAIFFLVVPIPLVSSAVACFACLLIMIVYTALALEQALQNETRILTARTLGARGLRLFARVVLPDALPHIMNGAQVTMSLALVYVIAMEAIIGGADAGLGGYVFELKDKVRYAEMHAAVFLTGLVGFAANVGFAALRRNVIHPWTARRMDSIEGRA